MSLRLQSMSITLQDYGDDKGKYRGNVIFVGQYGSMEIRLDPKLSQGCLDVCAEALVEHSKRMAETMTAAVIEQHGGKLLQSVDATE